jgi:hypothetical protein
MDTLLECRSTPMRLRVPQQQRERRADARLMCDLLVRCRAGNGLQWLGRAVDLSRGGACVRFWSNSAPPAIATLRFSDERGKDVVVPAGAVSIRRQGDFWLVGCAFVRQLTDEELTAIV